MEFAEKILKYCQGELSGEEEREVRRAVEENPELRELVEELRDKERVEREVRLIERFEAERALRKLRPARRRRLPAKTEGGWGKTRENFFSWSKKCGIMYPDMIWPGVGRNFRGK